jgi:hypothetical protein
LRRRSAKHEALSYTIPGTVTNLATAAFNGCTGLTSLTIPASISSPGAGLFANCTNLRDVTISNGVTSIGQETVPAGPPSPFPSASPTSVTRRLLTVPA